MLSLRFSGWRIVALTLILAPILAACSGGIGSSGVKRAAFTAKEFGVSASPRVTKAKYPPRGGGRYLSASAYVVRGVTYQPVDGPGYVARGEASWYGQDFHGRRTANGEIFGAYYLTAASPVLPVPCYARVTNLENGRSVLVRVNDRGPYLQGRVADLSYEAARILGYLDSGSAQVEIRYVAPAPLNGDDTRMLTASVDTPTRMEQEGDTRIAMLETPPAPHTLSLPKAPHRDAFSGGLVGDFIGLFGYAEQGDKDINGAVEAATAMATRTPALEDWKNAVDTDARRIRLELGTFDDPIAAITVAEQFAMLGAVDEDGVDVGGRTATRLTLTYLKPGVARADLVSLARRLGLTGMVFR